MGQVLPSYISGHVLAISGVILLHGGLATWVMAPEAPLALPQQQIIHVSMVAPTLIKQDAQPVEIVTPSKPPITTPPADTGMVKIDPDPVIEPKTEKPLSKKEPQKAVQTVTQTQLTSGLQSAEATELTSAITKPVAANYLKNPPPRYPRTARLRKQQGIVMLDVQVATNGAPKHIEIERSSGFKALDKAALSAVRKWKFVPARRGSQLVEANVRVPVEFRIN